MNRRGDVPADEFLDISKTVKISERILEELHRRKRDTGVPLSTQMRRAIERDILQPDESASEYPLLGYIPGGASMEVCPLPAGTVVRPPFKLQSDDCYALIVTGHSMESDMGLSIPDGSYAFFCPDYNPPPGAIVHVEWAGGADNETTLKQYIPKDGEVEFRPLNKKYKSIVKKRGDQFEIRGVYKRHWTPEKKPRTPTETKIEQSAFDALNA